MKVSATLISKITSDLDQEVSTWRAQPLEAVCPIVYFDGIVVHVRGENGRISDIPCDRRKIFRARGSWASGSAEGAKFEWH